MDTPEKEINRNDIGELTDEKIAKFLSGMTSDAEEEELFKQLESNPEKLADIFNIVSALKAGRQQEKRTKRRKNLSMIFGVAASVAILVVAITQIHNGNVLVSDKGPNRIVGTWQSGQTTLEVNHENGSYQATYNGPYGELYSNNIITKNDSVTLELRPNQKNGAKGQTVETIKLQGIIENDSKLVMELNSYIEDYSYGHDMLTPGDKNGTLVFTKKK